MVITVESVLDARDRLEKHIIEHEDCEPGCEARFRMLAELKWASDNYGKIISESSSEDEAFEHDLAA